MSGSRVVVAMRLGGRPYEVTFESASPLAASGDLDLAVSLLPAMTIGKPLQLDTPVSPRLLANVPRLQELLCHADRHNPRANRRYGYRTIPVEAETVVRQNTARGVACFFTGGVDSLYTTLKHRDEIDTIVFVAEGFDLRLDYHPPDFRRQVLDRVRRAAATLELPLVDIRTDLRIFSQQFVWWGDYNGAALAAVALLLREQFAKVFIPATLTYSHLMPQGTGPVTDPLWSTEDVELIHDGLEANRLEKIEAIATQTPTLLETLRVCLDNYGGAYNCGLCEKCLRTMTALRLAGAAHLCLTLPPLDPSALDAVAPEWNQRSIWEQLRAAAVERDPELADALTRFMMKPSH